jgi:hypothetical protein
VRALFFFEQGEGAWKDPEHAALIPGGYKVFFTGLRNIENYNVALLFFTKDL